MAEDSKIEWCDHTFNPWEGCAKVSPGCLNCYAEARNTRFGGGVSLNWGKGAPRRRTSPDNWKLPLKWNREATRCIHLWTKADCPHCCTLPRPRVFCASLADWLDDEVPAAWLADLLVLIHSTPNLDWLLLTKRPENWEPRMMAALEWIDESEPAFTWLAQWVNGLPLRPVPSGPIAPGNVWIGTTAEDQIRADQRIPELLKIPARVRFLSCEPLLGHLGLKLFQPFVRTGEEFPGKFLGLFAPEIDWIICGGESGANARPMHPDWARSLRDQCAAANVPFLFKQWGEWCAGHNDALPMHVMEPGVILTRFGKKAAGRKLDGVEHNAFPAAN